MPEGEPLKVKSIRNVYTTAGHFMKWFIRTPSASKVTTWSCSATHTASCLISTPWSTVLHGKLTVPQSVKKFPAFYRIEWFITVFTTASICPYPYSFRPVSIIHFNNVPHLRLGFPSALPQCFPHIKHAHSSPLPHTCIIPRQSHPPPFDHPNNNW